MNMFTDASSVRPEEYFRLSEAEKKARHIVHFLKKHGRGQVMDIIHAFLTSEPMGLNYASALYNQLPLKAAEYHAPAPEHFFDIANGKRESLLSSTSKLTNNATEKLAVEKTELDQREAELQQREAKLDQREAMLNQREAKLSQREAELVWKEPGVEIYGSEEEKDRKLEICKQLAFAERMQDENTEAFDYGEEYDRQLKMCKQLAFAQKIQDKDNRRLEWMPSDQRQFGCIPFRAIGP